MAISAETQRAIAHYQAIKDLIGEEDLKILKTFLDYAMYHLPTNEDGVLSDEDEVHPATDEVQQGLGLLCDIMDPEGIAEQDEGFTDGEDNTAD